MQLVDSHCHIHFDKFKDDIADVLDRAKHAKVSKMITVGCTLTDSEIAANFAAKYENVWASAGAHPHDGADYIKEPNADKKLAKLLSKPKVIAVGEIGLDYYHENSAREDQKKILHSQIEVGLKTDLPFIFHVRDAWEDFWEIFDKFIGIHGVIHSFSADETHLNEVLTRNLYVGLNGIMTFTKVDEQLEAAKKIPLDKLILETDAPFLAPKPFRGQTCEPKHVLTTAEFLAELRNEKLEDLAKATTDNVNRLFKI